MSPFVPILEESADFHKFEVDDNIISDLIHRQNGTVSTSLRELVMNALDAGSPRVDITIGSKIFEVKDQGTGFADEAAIMSFFKKFGTPHQAGDAKYGRFRIGRGQIMSFAKTTWHSKTFQMTADVANTENGFFFKKDAEFYNGCRVFGEFYKPLSSYDLMQAEREIASLVKYSPYPVYINQVLVSVPPTQKWDYEDEDLCILFNPKGTYGIHLYSQGILVKELHMFRYGIQADVVTKRALVLNMARNEINESDPLWIKVHQVLRAQIQKKLKNATTLTEDQRLSFIDQFLAEDLSFEDIYKLPLLKDIRGKSSSLYKEIAKKRPWTLCPNDKKSQGDHISVMGSALVLSESELSLWRCDSIELLLKHLIQSARHCENGGYWERKLSTVVVRPFDEIAKGVRNDYEHVAQKNLTPLERAQRNTLQYVLDNMCQRLSSIRQSDLGKRTLLIGEGPASAWTDSASFVAVDRKCLSLFENGLSGITQLVGMLLHELTHEKGSVTENGHDLAFYESFHDAVLAGSAQKDVIGNAIQSLKSRYTAELLKAELPFPHWIKDDNLVRVEVNLIGSSPTALLSWLLKELGIVYSGTRKKLTLQLRSPSTHNTHAKVDVLINRLLRKHGLSSKNIKDYTYMSDWKEAHSVYVKERSLLVAQALIKENLCGISAEASEKLAFFVPKNPTGGTLHCPFGGLSLLCDVPDFGVLSLHQSHLKLVTDMAGKGFVYSSRIMDDWRTIDIKASDMATNGLEFRINHYQNVLREMLEGITNEVDRVEFMNRFFSEEFKASF